MAFSYARDMLVIKKKMCRSMVLLRSEAQLITTGTQLGGTLSAKQMCGQYNAKCLWYPYKIH